MADQDRFAADTGSTFTPFWRRLPSFFVYPLQMGSMLLNAGFAFVVMERTANGRFDESGGMHDKEEGDAGQVTVRCQMLSQYRKIVCCSQS